MSWFASSLSLPRLSSPRQGDAGDKDEGEEKDVSEHGAGKGVKEDLSELTKSLTRQLWGVASFLTPPADKSSMSPKAVQVPQTDAGIPEIGEEKENDTEGESDAKDHPAHFGISGISAGDESTGISDSPKTSSPNSAGQKLTGFRSDLAELRGTVATSFSRIQSVIRSVTGDEDESGALETFTEGSEDGEPESPAGRGNKNSGFNSLFRPLLDGMLTRERPAGTDIIDGSPSHLAHMVHHEQAKEFEQHPTDARPSALSSGFDELSKLASSLLPFARDMVGEFSGEYAVGVTDEVVAFANNIAMHPETWLDFPLADEDDDDDFEMTEAQQEHADAVKHEASRLGAVHFELCPDIISNERFWKIYFVLLHSRLSKQDADLLSTPRIVKARGLLLQQLQDGEIAVGEGIPGQSGEKELVMGDVGVGVSYNEEQVMKKDVDDIGMNLITPDAHSAITIESLVDTQRSGQPSTVTSAALTLVDNETEVNEWLESSDDGNTDKNESTEDTVPKGATNAGLTNAVDLENADEDVSFSDLEDDENDINKGKDASLLVQDEIQINKSGQGTSNDPSQDKEFSGDTTPGSKFERVEFNDWFTVNEEDVTSADLSP